MMDFVTNPVAPDHVEYLDAAAGTAVGRDYKQRLLDALDVRAGHIVLDVGCGPGTDLGRLAEAVGATGAVMGIDHDAVMVDQARERLVGHRNVEVRTGDAHALAIDDASVDRARADRVLQHVADPARALAELRRVLRPGGMLGMAEPDWDTLVIDDVDVQTSRAFARFLGGQVRNTTIGRQLARLASGARLTLTTVDASTVVFRDFDAAEQILGLRRSTVRAVQAGVMEETVARNWLGRLESGPFLACFTLFTVAARA